MGFCHTIQFFGTFGSGLSKRFRAIQGMGGLLDRAVQMTSTLPMLAVEYDFGKIMARAFNAMSPDFAAEFKRTPEEQAQYLLNQAMATQTQAVLGGGGAAPPGAAPAGGGKPSPPRAPSQAGAAIPPGRPT